MKFVQRIGNKVLLIQFRLLDRPRERTAGMLNRCKDPTYFVPFLDYENMDFDVLIEILRKLQQDFGLSDWYIFLTRDDPPSYHCVCLDKLRFWTILMILDRSSCDYAYRIGAFIDASRSWTLRLIAKGQSRAPKYLATIHSEYYNGKHEQFKGLGDLLALKYGIEVRMPNPDDTEIGDVRIEAYTTAKRIKGEHLKEPLESEVVEE